jgi:hypothetical protein
MTASRAHFGHSLFPPAIPKAVVRSVSIWRSFTTSFSVADQVRHPRWITRSMAGSPHVLPAEANKMR